METRSSVKIWATKKAVILLVVLVLVLWAVNMAAYWLWPAGDAGNRGVFGDVFGASSSLFSALALLALFVAVLLQREELEHQRQDLKLTRAELQGQKEQLEGQKRQMEIQNFENRFFQMMKVWHSVREHIVGRVALFEDLATELKAEYEHRGPGTSGDLVQRIDSAVGRVWERRHTSLHNYMRILYQMFRLVDSAQVEVKEKEFYSDVIRAQTTQSELVLIFYNCLSSYGKEDFKPLVEKYALLKHLDSPGLIPADLRERYELGAFK
jgi:hypothetical protein